MQCKTGEGDSLELHRCERQTDRQTDRQTGRQAGREADRQAERQTETQAVCRRLPQTTAHIAPASQASGDVLLLTSLQRPRLV